MRSDNAGVVAVVNKGRARNANTNAVVQQLYALQAQHDLELQATYVPSCENIADALSRGDIKSFLTGFPTALARVNTPIPSHLADKIASW